MQIGSISILVIEKTKLERQYSQYFELNTTFAMVMPDCGRQTGQICLGWAENQDICVTSFNDLILVHISRSCIMKELRESLKKFP